MLIDVTCEEPRSRDITFTPAGHEHLNTMGASGLLSLHRKLVWRSRTPLLPGIYASSK
jgi:hypothetical protein